MSSRSRTSMPPEYAGANEKKKDSVTDSNNLRSEICAEYSSFDMIISKEERHNYMRSTGHDYRRALHELVDRLPEARLQAVFNSLSAELSARDLPEKAPELYKERADKTEKPDVFIRRVYEPWLGKGLLRPHVKDLDKSLYQALYKHGIPKDFDVLLPTAQGRAVEHLARSDAELMLARRESRRRSDQQRRVISGSAY